MYSKIMLSSLVWLIAWLTEIDTSPVGTWKYLAPDAAYEYSAGKIVVELQSDAYSAQVEVNGQVLKAEDVTYENGRLSFRVYIESELVSLDLLVEENSMKGMASYSEGSVELTATRE